LVTFAAVAPDLDALSYVGGEHVYARMHHALGHNVFFGIIVSVVSVLLLRGRAWKVLLFTQLAFYSHYFGDYFFTRFPVEFWWPVSSRGYVYSYRIGLDHPVNLFLSYLSFVVMVGMAVAWKRTPVEVVSPELDARVVNLFRRKAGRCDVCGRGANERCGGCGKAVCMRHGRIGWGFRVRCDACAGKRRKGPGGPRRRVEEVEGRVS
jgi:membrane-bound metal-dependent hydrolase YbcI (DUF457 family)